MLNFSNPELVNSLKAIVSKRIDEVFPITDQPGSKLSNLNAKISADVTLIVLQEMVKLEAE